jgi:uncharacterized protein (DUF58 family)
VTGSNLGPELLAKLELLRIATRRVHPGRFASRTRSRRLGAGIDFADHRPYTPGDDFKAIDWPLYARLDQLMIRLSEEETELHVHLLIDVSRSMDLTVGPTTTDPKSEVARLVATALAYVALANLDQVHVWPFARELGRPLALARRRSEVLRVGPLLRAAELERGTDLVQSVRSFLGLRPPRGVVVLVSDLGDPAWSKAVDHLLHERHDVGIVHLQTQGDIELPLEGEHFDLVDGETGEVLRGVTRSEVVAVRKRVREERERVPRFCRTRGIPLVQTVTGAPTDLEHLVLGLFRARGILR